MRTPLRRRPPASRESRSDRPTQADTRGGTTGPAAALVLVLIIITVAGCAGPKKPTDVILVVMDTTRADHLSVYGYERETTPNLESFASEAVVYERAWSTSSWTLPGHASLLTGRYVTAHGAHMRPDLAPDSLGDNPPRLPESVVTAAELLAEKGYHTAAFAGAGWLAPEFGLLQGYSVKDAKNLRDVSAGELTDRAIKWLDAIPPGEPVHLLLNYFDAHWPYKPPDGFDIFSGGTGSARGPGHDKRSRPPIPADSDLAGKLKAAIALYDGEIRYVDQQIGRLFEALRRLGRFNDALIAVVADHGESFGEHGAMGHGAWLYETVLRIPFIVRWPGGRNGGTRVEHPVSIVDMAPIIAHETGVKFADDIDGLPPGQRKLALAEEVPSALFKKHVVKGKTPLDRDLIAGIRWPRKLIINMPGSPELFRLDRDPGENQNLADGRLEARLLRDTLRVVSSLKPPEPEAPHPMSEEARARLKALGYME